MTAIEETPLLQVDQCHRDIYRKFSSARKKYILVMVSFLGVLPLFATGTFVPLMPQIAEDLNSTGAVVSFAVSIAVFATSIGSLLGSSYSTFYGRRPIFLVGMPVLIAASLCVATSQSIPQLLFWRFIQAMGSSPGLTIGSAVIGDIYKLEERGTALGFFFASILLGQALAPLVGGLAANYSSWRLLQAGIGLLSLWTFIIIFLFFPETHFTSYHFFDKKSPVSESRPLWVNPLRPLWLLQSPNFLFVSTTCFTSVLTYYVLIVPIAYTVGERYGITNQAIIGACILPSGLGNLASALIIGRFSDKVVVRWRAKRGGQWYPEDRLRAALPGALVITPLSVLFNGIVITYVPGKIGLSLSLLCMFCNGFGVDAVLGPSAAYFVDSLHGRSAEALAASSGFRQVLSALAISGIIPMIEKYGVLPTSVSCALAAWAGCLLLLITIRYGDRLRAVIDVGYSTAANN